MKTIYREELWEAARQWLNASWPPQGDGEWTIKFISEVFHGEHLGHPNRHKVMSCLAFAEKRMLK